MAFLPRKVFGAFEKRGPELKFENYETVQLRLQLSEIKKRAKISFHGHFKTLEHLLKTF